MDTTLRERVSRVLHPDFARTVTVRRIAAGTLVLLAAAAALRPDPAGRYSDVAVALADLRPGVPLTADDVRLEKRSAATLPDGVQTDLSRIIGATLAGPARRGEVLTDARVLGPRLAGLSAGPDARVVPLQLDDDGVLDVIRPGDVVDVLGAPADAVGASRSAARVLAAGAVVVLVTAPPNGTMGGGGRVVLVALPVREATMLAGASLVQAVTLTIH